MEYLEIIEIQRQNMVRNQIRAVGVENSNVMNAMLKIPRHEFVMEKYRGVAYSDAELPVNESGRLIARPEMLAQFLEAANIMREDIVLEIGCTTGYASAVIAQIAQQVIAVDYDKKLLTVAKNMSKKLNILNVEFQYSQLNNLNVPDSVSLILINGAIFTQDAIDTSHVQDKSDLFSQSSNIVPLILSQISKKTRILCVEGYYKYSPMNIVEYSNDSRKVLQQIYFPELSTL